MSGRHACFKPMCVAVALIALAASCYQSSYELALYRGAERLPNGAHFEYQQARKDCGVAAVAMLLRLTGQPVEYQALRRDVSLSRDGLSLTQIRDLMSRNALPSRGLKLDPSNLDSASFPLLAWLPTQHIVVIEHVTPTSAVISDPGRGRWKVSRATLAEAWDGTALVPEEAGSRPSLAGMRSDPARPRSTRGTDR